MILGREQFVTYLSKYISDVQLSKLLSAYLLVNSLGYIERETLSNVLFDELKRNRELELQLIHDALKGSSQAMIQLGDTYSRQKFTSMNDSKALMWYNTAKLCGDLNASCGICRHYYHFLSDYYFVKDFQNNPLHKSMCRNCIDFALCREAEECMFRDKEHAIEYFHKAADQKFAPAMYWLAISKHLGTKNMNFLKQVADLNYITAVKAMGDSYMKGESVSKDINEALVYYNKAAELGHDEAQHQIALAYLYSWGNFPKDIKKAIYWLRKSASQGNSLAIAKLSTIYLSGKIIPRDVNVAFRLLLRNHTSADRDIQRLLGFCYELGLGTSVDLKKATHHYLQAIHSFGGCSWAEIRLEQMCRKYHLVDETNVENNELPNIPQDTNAGTYSKDGKRFLCYWGTYGEEYTVADGCGILCDDSFNDLYSECDGHYLETLILPESLRRIGNNVFCASIKKFICNSPNFIVKNGFLLSKDEKILYRYFGDSECVEIPDGVVYIKGGAFTELDVKEIKLPANILFIGSNPFARTGILNTNKHVKIDLSGVSTKHFKMIDGALYSLPDKRLITYIGNESFLKVQDGIEYIGENAFFDANLTSIYLPASIKSIHKSAFYYCVLSLKTIIVPDYRTAEELETLLPDYVLKNTSFIINF